MDSGLALRAPRNDSVSRSHFGCGFGSTTDFDEPSGAACMPGGDCPCGLAAGVPPLPVVSGPVQPWGCACPLLSSGNVVRPSLCGESPGLFGSVCAIAVADAASSQQNATSVR